MNVIDNHSVTLREEYGSPAVCVSRKVRCALAGEGETAHYTVYCIGAIDFATRLHSPKKGERVHAIVSWRADDELAITAFVPVDNKTNMDKLIVNFFAQEVRIHKEMHSGVEYIFQFEADLTPLRKHKETLEAARILASPELWSKIFRKEIDE